MRLPLVHQLSTKDGVSNSNARLYNVTKETIENGELACIRPALRKLGETVGNGNGLVAFNDQVVSVYGATLSQAVFTPYSSRSVALPEYGIYNGCWGEDGFYVIQPFYAPREVYRTVDGVNYTSLGSSPIVANKCYLIYSNLLFVLTAYSHGSALNIWTSVDAVNWSLSSIPLSSPANVYGVAYNGTAYVINTSSAFYQSYDGVNWSLGSTSNDSLQGLSVKGSVFCCITGSSLSATSLDGITWERHDYLDRPYRDYGWYYLAASADIFCALDRYAFTPFCWTSTDGAKWTAHPITGKTFTSLVWTGTAFMAATSANEVYLSVDGRSWELKGAADGGELITDGNGSVISVPGNGDTGGTYKVNYTEMCSITPLTDSFFDFAQSTL